MEAKPVLLIDALLKGGMGRQRQLAKTLDIRDSAIRHTINREAREPWAVRPRTKRRYEAAINSLLKTNYTAQELFSPIDSEARTETTNTPTVPPTETPEEPDMPNPES